MKTISDKTTKSGLSVRTSIKAGGLRTINHNRTALKVRTGVKAGGLRTSNHNRSALGICARP